jgi:hypothetical protein
MYIFESDAFDEGQQSAAKSSKSQAPSVPALDGAVARVLLVPVVPAQTATLNGVFAPSAAVLSSLAESVAAAGVISTIGQAVSSDYATIAANEQNNQANLAASLEAVSKSLLANAGDPSLAAIPIASLSEATFTAPSQSTPLLSTVSVPEFVGVPEALMTLASSALPDQAAIDVSTLSTLGAPVVITGLSETAVTVIDNANSNIQIQDFVAPVASSESFINTGLGTLTVTTSATNVSSLSLSGKVAYTALADEVTSGITVSGQSDSSNITLFLVGGASSAQGSSDYITLGNGNNFVFDAGDGQVLLNLGSGQNTILLAGVGVSGVVNFAAHDNSVADLVAVAANGATSAHDMVTNGLLKISGLNNNAQSQDAINFLGDVNGQLMWSNGSASNSQVTNVAGDSANLESWINAAQAQAQNAHSVAWFQFGGNTYVYESVSGNAANHSGDTLIQLTGLTQFTNTNADLSIGMLHLAG